MARRAALALSAALLLAGLTIAGHGLWIPAKGWLAQQLLTKAWHEILDGATVARPWPWADGQPVAQLRWKRGAVRQIILGPASGRLLAFGPTHVPPSAVPGHRGHVVISAHRDTHFSFLGRLRRGDDLELESVHGVRRFRVTGQEILDLDRQPFVLTPEIDRLTLVTCYPLDGWRSGTRRRLLVHLEPVTS